MFQPSPFPLWPFQAARRACVAAWLGCAAVVGALTSGCTDPYLPEAVQSPPSYLVVDGFLNAQGATTIRLSRTYAVASKAKVPVETKAAVYIEEEGGTRLALREQAAGTYTSASQVLNTNKRYRLHLNTAGGNEYASDFVPVKITPPIDEVRWQALNTGLTISVNSHDDTKSTQYYRWETDETWEIRPPYRPSIEYFNQAIQTIRVPYPAICWGDERSTVVQIDKTTALTRDVVANFRLRQLPTTSERLSTLYSFLVQQYALTKEEYAYWDLLRKNTESIGTLFDPQPAQLTGNVHCLNKESELALGFVGAHSLQEKRIFIRRQELPSTWFVRSGYEKCVPPDTVFLYRGDQAIPPAQVLQIAFASQDYLPIEPVIDFTYLVLIGYTAKPRDCVDCRTRGSSVKPPFWP